MRHRNWFWVVSILFALALAPPVRAAEEEGAFLGVFLQDLSQAMRDALGLDDSGVLVEAVSADGPAGRAGVQGGDVLLRLGDTAVSRARDVTHVLDRSQQGESLEIVLLRHRDRRTVTVTLAARPPRGRSPQELLEGLLVQPGDAPYAPLLAAVPEPPEAPAPDYGSFLAGGMSALGWIGLPGRIGIQVQGLGGQLADYFGVRGGVLITWVVPDTPAGRAGVRAGDVIVAFDGQPVLRPEDLRTALPSRRREAVEVTVSRRGKEQVLRLSLLDPAQGD